MADGRRAESERLDSRLTKILDALGTEKLPADFVMRSALFFKKRNAAASLGQANGNHGASETAPYDKIVDLALGGHWGSSLACGFLRATHRCAGLKLWICTSRRPMPAAAHRSCHSAGRKARAMEAGPSCWTKG